jgi:hypothetical protein
MTRDEHEVPEPPASDASRMRTALRRVWPVALVLLLSIPIGTLWHELVGHGLTSVLLGGRIIYLEVLGVCLYPDLGWAGWQDRFGACGLSGLETATAVNLVSLAGSMSTWVVAVLATILLWLRRWPRWADAVLVGLSLWWFDLLTYTLPSWGVRRYVVWGTLRPEPYTAAVGLGIPGWAWQAFAVLTSAGLLAGVVIRIAGGTRRRVAVPGPPTSS